MAEQIFKKDCNYDIDRNNYQAESELMVTITLNEYRTLVASNSCKDADIKKAEADKYSRNQENDRLKKENSELKAELYELKKKFDSITDEESDENNE